MTTGPIPPGAHRLLNAPGFQESIRLQSEAFLQVNEAEPRLASIFATQQRWLMAHVGLSLHFEGESGQEPEGLTAARFLHRVHLFDIASRNTAAAFLGEMQHYGVVTQRPDARDRRKRYLLPTPITLAAIDTWLRIHLDTLDRLDGADRVARFDAAPGQIQHIQPMIADGLARSDVIRNPSPDFSHFMWINNGFLMTERFFAAIGHADAATDRFATSMKSMAQVASGLELSRTHASRKLREAEATGIIGWQDVDGKRSLWVARSFVEAFLYVQAAKLAIVDAAFAACIGEVSCSGNPALTSA